MRARGASALAFAAALGGCGSRSPLPPPAPPPVPLHLESACALAPSAGIEWIVSATPRALAELPDLIPVIALVVPESRFDSFTATHGGIDMRQIQELCVAKYRRTLLSIARTAMDPARVERAFQERVTNRGGRQIDVANPPVVRIWGEVNGEAQQVVLFGREVAALEQGRPGPVRAAEAFALGKLRRASPALEGTLARVVALVGDAPVRLFAPGPFDGEGGQGLGGLLRASTAIGASARLAGAPAKIAVRIVLTGAWGKDGPAAASVLAAAANVIAQSPLGRLLGLDHPLVSPQVRAIADALVLEATLDGSRLGVGLHDALDADIADIMRR